ncbi:hypothetical protein [Dysgonomonas sp. 521]|uniref:hypothetical protein n=1 Tax=Dysgonomonas sp. 521 TaxID=2302932 RepID=UPI0013D25C9E|nr:hypothetical protein [Dysgonomonas sp. 521]
MKKLLFMLFATTLLLVSCDDNNPIDDNKKYKVTFKVSLSDTEFGVESGTKWPVGNYCQYVIYKENGDVYTTKVMEAGTLDADNIRIVEEIPYGNYHIAVISAKKTANGNLAFEPSKYDTDYCNGNHWAAKGRDNRNIYFETLSFNFDQQVSADIADLQLKPAWSYVSVRVKDADVCTLPEGTTHVQCVINPYYYGFSIKDKKPVSYYEQSATLTNTGFLVSVGEFREDKAILDIVASKSQDAVFKLVFIKHSQTESATILGEKVIYTGNIENGEYITLAGNLGDDGEPVQFEVNPGEVLH